ncbi:hypothetical protein QBC38DRAFT_172677 [Podospora fimiseda]|uniref:Uncharacterized protein n=1 Tax=Podospora fimiseda TaxID=252190 RepID=A0AAN7BRU3_9PEZI|nr:hypothetical protein QBC38DRAFT_172677 [Podospora fimiseda]
MDTITQYATAATNAATKVIWGEQPNEKEPVNGRMGNVAAGEPYDAGNIESSSTALKTTTPNPELNNQPQVSHVQDSTSKDDDFNKNANPLAQKVALPAPTPSERQPQQKPPSPPLTPNKYNNNNPSTTLPSSTLTEDSTKSQNDTRSPSNPSTKPGADGDDKKPDALDANNNPVKIDGPGPKPLAEVARERGGDAGAVFSSSSSSSASASFNPANGNAIGGQGLETKESNQSTGTGELYVKSSGLAADGGDFDASKPGAGREADRLMEEKGIHHIEAKRAGEAGEKKHHHLFGGGDKEGPGLREKIKAKLHHH